MPMGIVSDTDFDTEIKRVGNGSVESNDTADTDPLRAPDTTVDIKEEVSDYEPKEPGNIGLELHELGSTNGTDQNEISIPNQGARIHQIQKGRTPGRNNRTPEEREIIAGEALIAGTRVTAQKFGIADSTVSAYKHGATSTSSYNEPDDELLKSVSARRIKIAGVAHGKLSEALDQITTDKLAAANLKTIASVAQSMSAIIKNMEPEVQQSNTQNVQFTFYAPKVRSEDAYDVIDLQAE